MPPRIYNFSDGQPEPAGHLFLVFKVSSCTTTRTPPPLFRAVETVWKPYPPPTKERTAHANLCNRIQQPVGFW